MQKAKTNQVRIGGGEWRSRLLKFADSIGLRPTPDRVRQTLFNWLGQELYGYSCLDLFAGTGALGFESLSRGAKHAVIVEKSSVAFKFLLENKATLNAENAQILNQDALQFLAQNQQAFDVIYLDPPYNQGWLDKLLPLISPHLALDGWIYVEAEYELLDILGYEVVKQGKSGNVFYHLLKVVVVKS